jgi:flagellar biosynthesis protein FlhF
MAKQPVPIAPGKKYKFTVKSAEEAASIIREKLGETAEVISVRQVEGEGLARFLKSPKLEIIAQVPPPKEPAAAPKPLPAADSAEDHQAEQPSSGEEEDQVARPSRKKTTRPRKAKTAPSAKRDESEFVPEAMVKAMFDNLPTGRLWTLLAKAGIPEEFLAQIGERPESQLLERQPLQTAISSFALLMRDRAPVHTLALGRRVAFFGTPGAGSTTALCKQLASDVFLKGRTTCVMKLDADEPNSTEGLAMFCEALGVPLVRTPGELGKVDPETTVYFDAPGIVLNGKNVRQLRRTFDAMKIESRVLVVNAAYERVLMQEAYTRATALGGTHVVFTHLDEIPRFGKLWEFVLDEGLAPLFASTGPNIAADFDRHVVDLLVRRTLSAGEE